MNFRKFMLFITRFKDGYTVNDNVKIFLHNLLYLILYPINHLTFISFKKNIVHPKMFFRGFIVKNSDGVFFCRDNVNLDVVSETFEYNIRSYFKNFHKGIFLDIGSNIGKYTIMVGNQLNGRGKVISIEPHPANFEILKKSIELNKCKNVIPLKLAAWKKRTRLKLFNQDQPVLSSVVNPSKDYISVEGDSVDNILKKLEIKKVDFIKIDVEGGEPQVLEGMKFLLKREKMKIIFEALDDAHARACKRILGLYNYKIERIDKLYWMASKQTMN